MTTKTRTDHIGDGVRLVSVEGQRGKYEVSTNKDPVVLTLRNTTRLLLAKTKEQQGRTESSLSVPTSKFGVVSSALKIGVAALGGIAALLYANESGAAETAGTPQPVEPTPDYGLADKQAIEEVHVPGIDSINGAKEYTKQPESNVNPTAKKEAARTYPASITAGNGESVDNAVARAAKDSGEDPKQLRAMIHLESKGDPRARSGQYLGLGQIGASAWKDVIDSTGVKLPELTNDADDPRFDPYTNALVTAKLMGLNRKRLAKAAKAAGYQTVTLGLLYSAHNVGATTTCKVLAEKDSSKWDATTKKFIGNQARELTNGGIGNYLANAERSMDSHYASANVNVDVAKADNLGVMSSVSPAQLPQSQRVASVAEKDAGKQLATARVGSPANVPIKVSAYTPRSAQPQRRVISAQQEVPPSQTKHAGGSQEEGYAHEEPFRLRNGKMASV